MVMLRQNCVHEDEKHALILEYHMEGLTDDKIGQVVLRTLKEMEMLLVGQLHCL